MERKETERPLFIEFPDHGGVNVKTITRWEDEGGDLRIYVDRPDGGYRSYSLSGRAAHDALRVIKAWTMEGFDL
jgi:DNA-binding transcriptional MerR regulator